MNLQFSINGVKSEFVNIEEVNLTVDYTVEEFAALIKMYGDSLPTILAALKQTAEA